MNLLCIPPDRAGEAWPLAEPFIRSALDHVGLMSVADISSGSLLWLAVDEKIYGAGVTSLAQDDKGKYCELIAWGSDDHARCDHLLKDLEDYARAEGCNRLRLTGRKGWRKLDGFKEIAVILEKAL